MKRFGLFLGIIIIALGVGGLFTVIADAGTPLSPEAEDFALIRDTLNRFSEIKVIANYTGDWNNMVEVLANDPRGGELSRFKVSAVQAVRNDPGLDPKYIGLLDYFLAVHQFDQRVLQLALEAEAQGRLVIPTIDPQPKSTDANAVPTKTPEMSMENYTRSKDDLYIVPEIVEYSTKTGLTPRLPRPLPEDLRPLTFKILSIAIKGDLAYAQVDWEYGLEEDILVKKDGKWFLIGQKVLQWHGG